MLHSARFPQPIPDPRLVLDQGRSREVILQLLAQRPDGDAQVFEEVGVGQPQTGYDHSLRCLSAARAAITYRKLFFPTFYGPEFIAKAVLDWAAAVGAKTALIEPGSTWENGYCENFNSKPRNGEIFYSLAEARVVIEA